MKQFRTNTYRVCIFLCLYFSFCLNLNAGNVLAFPEALGFGQYATGGRGGTVYHVTNLNDSGTGSFRDAVSKSNRIVVFDVSGYIQLKTAVSISSNITIAGQTAPGEGVGIRSGKLSCGKQSNIIIRHLRMRPGDETASNEDVAINLLNAHNIILDHCSIEFAPWNNIGGVTTDWQNYPVTDITIQSCLIANPIYQQFGAHCESPNSDWAWFYNAFANTHNRNPLDKVNDVFVNNILYNYQGGYTTHTSTKFKHDIVNNYFVMGPNSGSTDNTWYQVDKNQSIYYSGNMKDKNKDGVLNGSETTPYWYQGTGTVLSGPWSEITKNVGIYSAATAYRMVSSLSGTYPRDEMDRQVWGHIQSLGKAGAMYKSQTTTGLSNNGYGEIKSGTKAEDGDNDGIPDYWELANGLNPNKDDAMTIAADGYANIEKYINWLGGLHAITDQNVEVEIDLAGHTTGWSQVSPSYSVSNSKNGSVAMSGSKAKFTPEDNFSGMASFDFTVKGNDNTTYTTTIHVLVMKGEDVVYENPSLTKQGGGSSNQTIRTNQSIADFNYLWENAKTVEITWSPSEPVGITTNIDKSKKTISFSGTPASCGTYSFTVSTVGATTVTSKSGSIIVLPQAYIYEYDNNGNMDWAYTGNWNQGYAPYDCDTAIVRTGEVNVLADVRAITYVDENGVFRIRANLAVKELHLVGGTLKSYTSNPQFRLTATNLYLDQESTILCGSLDTSEFKISGKISGAADVTKTSVGILTLNADASDFSGRWILTEGTIRLSNANGLGSNGVTVSQGSALDIDVEASTNSVVMNEGSSLNLDANLTVESATLGSIKLSKGTYSSSDYPDYISGSGLLVITEETTGNNIISNNAPELILSPNPAKEYVLLTSHSNREEKYKISIADVSGKVEYTTDILLKYGKDEHILDLSSMNSGLYIITLVSENNMIVKKLLIE